MKTRLFLLIMNLCAFSGLGVSSLSARIGETFEEIEARYGPQVARSISKDELGNPTLLYNFKDFTIEVTFVNKRCVREFFVKYKDHVPADRWERMTEPEVDAILAGYDGVKWDPGQTTSTGRPLWWTSADGRLKAINMANQLVIGTVDYLDKLTAHRKQVEEEKLKGF